MAASWAEAKAGLPQLPISILLFLSEQGQLHVLVVHNPSHTAFLLRSITHKAASSVQALNKDVLT